MPPTEDALEHLRRRVPELPLESGAELETDLFVALAKGIVGRSGAYAFAWSMLGSLLGEVTPERVLEVGPPLEALGKRTAASLLGAAKGVRSGRVGMERLSGLSDDEAVAALRALRGVDVPLAVRVLIGVLRRPDVLRFDDGAAREGFAKAYGVCSPERFAAFRERCAPHGSAATLCLWSCGERLRTVFPCEDKALAFLKRKDKRLGALIERLGPIRHEVEPDLFTALIDSIIAQQISGHAARAVSERLRAALGAVTPEAIAAADPSVIQQCGLSGRKVGYVRGIAQAALSGALDWESLRQAPDDELIRILSSLDGIGVWTAEMLMFFSLCRPDVLSWGDLGIRRGMALLYGDRELTRERFERRRKRYAPYGSVASLYFWALAGMEEPLARKLAGR